MNATDRTKRSIEHADSRTASASPEPRPSAALRRSTGRDRAEWFALLDTWGAPGREYREIADWLSGEQGLSDWWAQKLIVEYEQARGLRPPGIRSDGTFTVSASKAVAAPAEVVFEAITDPMRRRLWLPDVAMHERSSKPGRSARFDWEEGAQRVNVTVVAAGAGKSQVAVEHEHLPDATTADRRKGFWRERLAALKTLLES